MRITRNGQVLNIDPDTINSWIDQGWKLDLDGDAVPDMGKALPSVDIAALTAAGVIWQAHRGGGEQWSGENRGPVPENTLEGARITVEMMASRTIPFVLGVQVRELADGGLGVIHDITLDRTTTATGNVFDTPTTQWLSLTTDAGSWWGGGWGNLPTPLLDDYLRTFGGRVAMEIEAATPGGSSVGDKITAKIVARGLQNTVVLSSFSTAQLLAAKAAGIATKYLPPAEGQAGADVASILATNVWAAGQPQRVSVDVASSDAYITSLVSAGLFVAVHGVGRRYERDRAIALGAKEVCSADIVYIATGQQRVTRTGLGVDPVAGGSWPVGLLPSDQKRGRGILTNGGIQLDYVTSTGTQMPVLGYYSGTVPTSYTFATDVVWDVLDTDATRWACINFGIPDDRAHSLISGTGGGLPDGYQFLLRQNGAVGLSRLSRSSQAGAGVTPASGPAQTAVSVTAAGTVTRLVATVTPTTITCSVVIAGTTYGPWVYNDATYRGAYVSIGKATNGATRGVYTFKNTTLV